jgi:hypothetical protein
VGEFRVVISPCLNISAASPKRESGVLQRGALQHQGPVGPQPLFDKHIIYFASSNTHCDTGDQDQDEDVSLFQDIYGW